MEYSERLKQKMRIEYNDSFEDMKKNGTPPEEIEQMKKTDFGYIFNEEMPKIPLDTMIAKCAIGPHLVNSIPFYLIGKLLGKEDLDQESISALEEKGAALPDEYSILAILSGDKTDTENRTLFWAYRSKSEVGLWRLCYSSSDTIPGYDKLSAVNISFDNTVKGDYVQSTLIHIELQKFINERIGEVVNYNGPNGVFNTELENNIIPYGLMYKYLKDGGNTISCNLFYHSSVDLVDETSNEERETLINDEINPQNRQIKPISPPFNFHLDECGTTDTGMFKLQTLETIYSDLKIFSDSFENHYTISENVPIITNYSATINLSGRQILEISVTGDIYSVTLRSNTLNTAEPELNVLKLIYLRTKKMENLPEFEDENNEPYDPNIINYYMPIALLPSTSECNKYGIYSKYIYAGNYICKIFDYSKQCPMGEVNKYICTTKYSFIGNRYLNIFPYKQIQESMTTPQQTVENEIEPTVENEIEPTVKKEIQQTVENVMQQTLERLGKGLRRSVRRKNKRRITRKRRTTRKRRKTQKRRRGSRRR